MSKLCIIFLGNCFHILIHYKYQGGGESGCSNLEIWQFTVSNERDSVAELSVFSLIEFCLWDAADGELQWTMDTQSFTNEDLRQDAQKLADLVYAELEAKGFIK